MIMISSLIMLSSLRKEAQVNTRRVCGTLSHRARNKTILLCMWSLHEHSILLECQAVTG